MRVIGILMTISSVAAWIAITWIIAHMLRDASFRVFLIFRKHKKMLTWIIILSALMFVLAFFGGKYTGT